MKMTAARKIAITLAFVFAAVATPRDAFWLLGTELAVLVAVGVAARVRWRWVMRHLAIEVPFLAFAIMMPLVGRGPRVDVLGVSLSERGLWAAWNIVAKATLGTLAATLLIATTAHVDLLRGLRRLRVPGVFVSICFFMLRYTTVLAEERRRMQLARPRAATPRAGPGRARPSPPRSGPCSSAAYERGERVHQAMLARGYTGDLPDLDGAPLPGPHVRRRG